MVRSKTSARKTSTKSPTNQIQILQTNIKETNHQLESAYKKAIEAGNKQLNQLKQQLTKAKQKLSQLKKIKPKQESGKKNKLSKAIKIQPNKNLLAAHQNVKDLLQEILDSKKQQELLLQDQRKFSSSLKAMTQFERQWKKKNVKSTKIAKEKKAAPKKKTPLASTKRNKSIDVDKKVNTNDSLPSIETIHS